MNIQKRPLSFYVPGHIESFLHALETRMKCPCRIEVRPERCWNVWVSTPYVTVELDEWDFQGIVTGDLAQGVESLKFRLDLARSAQKGPP